mmetsp:Transcript_42325/g.64924  ORF Transcript_42325/g.64924 Transcript_42325/m.64924 type:complete len:99 (-) Transcript_42325:575-871(-)
MLRRLVDISLGKQGTRTTDTGLAKIIQQNRHSNSNSFLASNRGGGKGDLYFGPQGLITTQRQASVLSATRKSRRKLLSDIRKKQPPRRNVPIEEIKAN